MAGTVRKILIVTPLRGDLSASYLNTLFRVMGWRVPGVSFGYAFIGATSVQWARDEGVQMARDKECDEIIFWDKDLEPSLWDWQRIVQHDSLDIVCSLYAKREPLTTWHATFVEGKEADADGVTEVHQAAVGFCKIKMSVFDKLRAKYPERAYTINNAGMEPRVLHEYFPMERVGPNTAEGKLNRIKEICEPAIKLGLSVFEKEAASRWWKISNIVFEDDFSKTAMHGEDYGFCRLAREVGIPIHLDIKLVIPHTGECQFPIPTQMLEQMAAEEWRNAEISK